jgi:mlo protein
MLPFAVEMMLLGFISLLLAATSRIISGICIDSKYYNSRFSPCTKEEVKESIDAEHAVAHARKRLIEVILHHSLRRNLKVRYHNHQGCPEVCNCFNFQSASKNLSISDYCTRIYITFASFFLERSFDVQGHESFVSHEGLEQLHRFIFVMAVTHVTYSCLTMLLAILKVLTLLHFYIKHKLILSIEIHSTVHTYLEN